VAAGKEGRWWGIGVFLAMVAGFGLLLRTVVVGRERNEDALLADDGPVADGTVAPVDVPIADDTLLPGTVGP